MKMYAIRVLALIMVSALALSGCVVAPAPEAPPAAAPEAASPAEPAGQWQTYTDAEVGFSIQYPSTWSPQTLPDQNQGAIHGMAFTGPEGGVEVYWGVGFGGACPTETVSVQVSGVELPACHATDDDGAEVWNLIGYEVSGGNSFSLRAYTSDAEPASHDLVLQVLATLTFMPPAETEAGATIVPLPVEVCNGQAQAMAHFLAVLEVTQSEEPLTDYVSGATGAGCQATVTGTGEQFESPDAAANILGDMLEEQGWTMDPMLAAGGPTGIGLGYRNGDQICLVAAGWRPAESANCPPDQPISACEVTPAQRLYTVTLNCGVEASQETAAASAGMPNPASVNCIEQGGTLAIEERSDLGQIGVCTFEDNRQCEEWALLRGDCPVGGVKVTGYATPAARYCAITGGAYAITGNSGQDDEQGACTLPHGAQCDAWDYYNGLCDASTAAPVEPATAITTTLVITYTPGPPTARPRAGRCWTNSLAVWRADAWRCQVSSELYDPCFEVDDSVICGASPVTATASFALLLTAPLPAPETPQDTTGHAWLVELADGTVCGFATGATGGVGGERINYFCPSQDPDQSVVILGDLQPGTVWMAKRVVLTGSMPDLTVLESAMTPVRTVWR